MPIVSCARELRGVLISCAHISDPVQPACPGLNDISLNSYRLDLQIDPQTLLMPMDRPMCMIMKLTLDLGEAGSRSNVTKRWGYIHYGRPYPDEHPGLGLHLAQ